MRPERWRRVEELLESALGLEAAERDAWLAQACADDPELHSEVESLLAFRTRAEGFLEGAPADWLPAPGDGAESFAPGDRCGPFRITGLLGAGGMGVVYRAEQPHPRRAVALKVIPPGLASRRMLRRFEHEADVLGRLQHPHIAQIFEAGTADSAAGPRPYFAMELVEGLPLLEYAAMRRLGARARVELLAAICRAVEHAHQKGVLHRDLKPANVLVTEVGSRPIPKVLDFGVARVTEADVRVTTLEEGVHQLIGTLAYMSPEQVAGDSADLDLRSDVYSLAVLGYELLAGRLPLDLEGRSLAEAARIITHDEPPRLGALDASLAGDVETILAKGLEKDRERRYASAGELADDLERHLREEPIRARSASAIYQLRKFARRNRSLVTAALLGVLALVTGTAAATWQALVARGERDRALEAEELAARELAKAEAAGAFLEEMLRAADPLETRGAELTVAEVLAAAAARVAAELAPQPEVQALVQNTIGHDYLSLGLYEEAERLLQHALATRRALPEARPADVARTLALLALVAKRLGDVETAEERAREALGIWREHRGEGSLEYGAALDALGQILHDAGRYGEAADEHRRALELHRARADEPDAATARSLSSLGQSLFQLGRREEAEEHLRRALSILRGLPEAPIKARNDAANGLAQVLLQRGATTEAEELFREQLEVTREVLGDDHPALVGSLNNLASVQKASYRFEEAGATLREAYALGRERLGAEHPSVVTVGHNLADLLSITGALEEAEELQRHLVSDFEAVLGPDHPTVAVALNNHAFTLWRLGRLEEARRGFGAALALRRRVLPPDHPGLADVLHRLAMLAVALDEPAAAEEHARACLAIRLQNHGEDHWLVAFTRVALGRALTGQGRFGEAEELLDTAHGRLAARFPPENRFRVEALEARIDLLEARGEAGEAAALRAEWVPPEPAPFWPGPPPGED